MRIPQWTVASLPRDRKFSISAFTQSTVENADCCGMCESAFTQVADKIGLAHRNGGKVEAVEVQLHHDQVTRKEKNIFCALAYECFSSKLR